MAVHTCICFFFVSNLHALQVLLNERRLLRGVCEELHEGDAVVIEGSVGQRFSYHLVQSTESAMILGPPTPLTKP